MSQNQNDFTKRGFAKTFVLPALLVFLVPILGLMFFLHAQGRFDAQAREAVLQDIRADTKMTAEERAKAIEFFTRVPFSRLIRNPEFAANVDPTARSHYATFRWMIFLSAWSIVSGIAVFLLGGLCVLLSLSSQLMQYLSLLVGWHVLRIYSALQTIVLGILLLALSFWVTALWFNFYSVKLIVVAGLVALLGAVIVIAAIFKRQKNEFVVEGTVIEKEEASPLWQELNRICAKVGTKPPDQVIAGIDDNFFVTEQPVTVDGKQLRGKTLFVSLPLLKQLNSAEADAVLAHEMAHFSGQDTVYAKRISPLLQRYQSYLQSLHEGGITLPVFYFMLCFRALFELSLGKLSRQREFRADKIAGETTSPRDCAGALLRIAAYSKFRQEVQQELFSQEQAMASADVSNRIERGFLASAVAFAADPKIGEMETVHPFDTHPPMLQRLNALGVELVVNETQALLGTPGDGGWHRNISGADELERQQWQVFEERFRQYHEASLPYRFLPATPEEQAIVEKTFPPVAFTGKEGTLSIDYEKVRHEPWPDALLYSEISKCELSDEGVLQVLHQRKGEKPRSINTKKFEKTEQAKVLEAFQNYYGRYLAAVEYQNLAKAKSAAQLQASVDNSLDQ